jgi:hypothetical protein
MVVNRRLKLGCIVLKFILMLLVWIAITLIAIVVLQLLVRFWKELHSSGIVDCHCRISCLLTIVVW